jgi:ATP-dependent helicase HrpB
MVGARGVRLWERAAVTRADLFVCVDVEDVGQAESIVRLASAVDRTWLPDELLRTTIDIAFDVARERVVATRRVRYLDLPIDEAATDVPNTGEVTELLAREAAKRLDRALPLGEPAVGQFLARVRSLREWLPELNLPAFDDDALRSLLPQLCAGRRSFAELRGAPLVEYLKGALTPAQLQSLERDAPERLPVPSGNRITLRYEPGRPPVLAVRIQELFGLRETPRVARGRVAVLLHLLAPSMRPQQVTDDLASFWNNVYPKIRKELSRRYPKHAWPEEPITASPQRGPKRR